MIFLVDFLVSAPRLQLKLRYLVISLGYVLQLLNQINQISLSPSFGY